MESKFISPNSPREASSGTVDQSLHSLLESMFSKHEAPKPTDRPLAESKPCEAPSGESSEKGGSTPDPQAEKVGARTEAKSPERSPPLSSQ